MSGRVLNPVFFIIHAWQIHGMIIDLYASIIYSCVMRHDADMMILFSSFWPLSFYFGLALVPLSSPPPPNLLVVSTSLLLSTCIYSYSLNEYAE